MMSDVVNVMVDLETLSCDVDAVIVSIGAVAFDPDTGVLGGEFECLISIDDSVANGFKVCDETVEWWLDLPDVARKQLNGHVGVEAVLVAFSEWLGGLCDRDDLRLWGNGARFDLGKLEYHFKHFGMSEPWGHWNDECVRRQVRIGRKMDIDPKKTLEFIGEPHTALADAKHQARYVSVIEQCFNGVIEAAKGSGWESVCN